MRIGHDLLDLLSGLKDWMDLTDFTGFMEDGVATCEYVYDLANLVCDADSDAVAAFIVADVVAVVVATYSTEKEAQAPATM